MRDFLFVRMNLLDYYVNKKRDAKEENAVSNRVNCRGPDMSRMEKQKKGTVSEHIFRSLPTE